MWKMPMFACFASPTPNWDLSYLATVSYFPCFYTC